MVEWRERGYVQDSDAEDECELSNGESQGKEEGGERRDRKKFNLLVADEEPDGQEKYAHAVEIVEIEQGLSNGAARPDKTEPDSPRSEALEDGGDLDELSNLPEHQFTLQPTPGISRVLRTSQVLPQEAVKKHENSTHASLFDIPSSPLSEPPASPLSYDVETRGHPSHFHQEQGPLESTSSIPARAETNTTRSTALKELAAREEENGGRFRQRNPIQLHPYLLEQEQYRQTLKAHGERPVVVTITHTDHRHTTDTAEDGTNAQDVRDNSQTSDFDAGSSSPPSSPLQEAAREGIAGVDIESDNDMFLGRKEQFRMPTYALQHGVKRRRLLETLETSRTVLTTPQIRQRNDDFGHLSVYKLPPSPATTSTITAQTVQKIRLKKFRMPKAFLPAQLPTPTTSSDAGLAALELEDCNSEAETHDDGTAQVRLPTKRVDRTKSPDMEIVSANLRSPSPSASEQSDWSSEKIRQAQRRIKGVLPGSWLRLDQQAQARKVANERRAVFDAPLPQERGLRRGVAQRVRSGRGRSRSGSVSDSLDSVLGISDDSSTSQPGTPARRPSPVQRLAHPNHLAALPPADTQDIVEEDFVDAMLPTASRHRHKNSGRKCQPRIVDVFHRQSARKQQNARNMPSGTNRSVNLHPERERAHRTERARRECLLKLGIVDSASLRHPGLKPDFLRLAVRKARSRGDVGRQGPLGKMISLHNRYDDMEATEVLRRWTRVRPVTRNLGGNGIDQAKASRAAFSPLSHNEQQRLPSPAKLTTKPAQVGGFRFAQLASIQPPRLRQRKLEAVRISGPLATAAEERPHERRKAKSMARLQRQNPSINRPLLRPGQLEEFQTENDEVSHEQAFRRDILTLDSRFEGRRAYQQRVANPLIARYLGHGDEEGVANTRNPGNGARAPKEANKDIRQVASKIRHSRKRLPQHMNVEDFEIDVVTSPVAAAVHGANAEKAQPAPEADCTVTGLAPYGTQYTPDFDVKHLPARTYFHHTTFIGSGELRDTLMLDTRDLDIPASTAIVHLGKRTGRWGPWVEEVSTQLGDAFAEMERTIRELSTEQLSNPNSLADAISMRTLFISTRSVIRYVSKALHFLDAIDRDLFVGRLSEAIVALVETLIFTLGRDAISGQSAPPFSVIALRLLTYLAVLMGQVFHVASHHLVKPESKAKAEQVLRSVVLTLGAITLRCSVRRLWALVSACNRQRIQETGIHDAEIETEALVVLSHVLHRVHLSSMSFWDVVNHGLYQRSGKLTTNLAEFESIWHDIFAILPLLDFDNSGMLDPSQRSEHSPNWSVVKQLLSRTLDLYSKASLDEAPTLNPYVRAVMSRCHHMVRKWHWSRCEPALNCIFDFFARSGLALLRNEEAKGSPAFLAKLDIGVSAELEPGDRSFDIFLKMLYMGLRDVKSIYDEKKTRNIVWRFIPNHGRQHEKEQALRHDDLDKLRNHHDLLCVLYAASPPRARPSIDLLRNLVNFGASHSEVCRLNIRSWANLVRFQLSTDEPASSIDSFVEWFNAIVRPSMSLRRNARAEAESQYQTSRSNGMDVSNALLETIVVSNEKHVEGVLTMALTMMQDVLTGAQNRATASRLFEMACISEVLSLFDTKQRRLNAVVSLAVGVYQTYFELQRQGNNPNEQPSTSDDSQNYEGWPDDDELAATLGYPVQPICINATVMGELQQLLSNCFGVESCCDEALLTKLADTWVRVCQLTVKSGHHDWNYYLDQHSPGSWNQLRNTDQQRKFLPYFLSRVVEMEPSALEVNPEAFISGLLISLLERESLFKFQHRLANAVLNAHAHALALIHNLPFAVKNNSQRFDVSLSEIRERRLATVSTILANMRTVFEDATVVSSNEAARLRHAYTTLLRQMMHAMKHNYEETQHGSIIRGAYVDFVQQVVEGLQQYTSDICPVDHFFTNSAAFPLPSSDPTYVVGRLKNYGLRTSDVPTQKKLAIFVHTLCERAFVEGHQEYLVGQMKNSVSDIEETGDATSPSLRCLLVRAVFPAYVESLFTTDCGWIFARSIFDAMTYIFDDLMYHLDTSDINSVARVTAMLTDMLRSVRSTSGVLIDDPTPLSRPNILNTLAAAFGTLTRAACIVDYVHRSTEQGSEVVGYITYFIAFGRFILEYLRDPTTTLPTTLNHEQPSYDSPPFKEIRAFCKRDLQEALTKNWVKQGSAYFVMRGSSRKEVVVNISTLEEETVVVKNAIEAFVDAVDDMPEFAGLDTGRRGRGC